MSDSPELLHSPVEVNKYSEYGVCFHCKVELTRVPRGHNLWKHEDQDTCSPPTMATVDHLLPKKLGGSDEPRNKVWSCFSCNVKKLARLPKPHELKKAGLVIVQNLDETWYEREANNGDKTTRFSLHKAWWATEESRFLKREADGMSRRRTKRDSKPAQRVRRQPRTTQQWLNQDWDD